MSNRLKVVGKSQRTQNMSVLPPSIRGVKAKKKKYDDAFNTVSHQHKKQLEMRGGFSTDVEPQLVCTERELP